jgi:crotonobetainyl-CoA:carnitine CoA-transferase CaiB-like acyl-CoA transferase
LGVSLPIDDSLPLADLRVLDLSWVGVGPITVKYLADHGATAIRVESHARYDVVRLGPPWHDAKPGIERSQFYASYNTSKLGIALDLSRPEAQAIARRLAAWADVVVESFTPRVLRGWGLAWEDLRRVNPRLVMMSTCLQGQTGPHALHPGFGQLMAALSGFYEVSGWPDRDPAPPYGAYTDFVVPRLAATALLAAIDHQRRTGEGQYLDVSQFEASLHFLAPALLDHDLSGRVAGREGNRSDHAAPHGAYPCAGDDRWIALSVRSDGEWRALARALGRPAWLAEERFATHAGRVAAGEALDAMIAETTRGEDAQALMDRLQAGGVAAGVVQCALDLHADPVLAGWGFFQWLEHPERPPAPYDGHALRLEGTPGRLRRAAPALGEHTALVLREVLGMDDAEVQRLIDAKIAW